MLESYVYARDLGFKYNRYIQQGIDTAHELRNNSEWEVIQKPSKYYIDIKHVLLRRRKYNKDYVSILTDRTEYYVYTVKYNNEIYQFENMADLEQFLDKI